MTKEIHDINTRALDFVVELIEYIFEYPDDDYMTMECLCRKLHKYGLIDKADGYYQTHDKRTVTHECVKDTHDKTENSSEIPNNCEDCRNWNHNYGACTEIECNYEPNNFDKDINVRSKDEPQINASQHVQHVESVETMSCQECRRWIYDDRWGWFCPLKGQDECKYEPKNEPQTDNLFTDKYGDVWEWRGNAWYCISGDEPQTERGE